MSQRRPSKTLGIANRIIWTEQEVFPAPFTLDGLAFDGAQWGQLRVMGGDLYCTGFRVDFRVPSGSAHVRCAVSLTNGAGNVIVHTLSLDGVRKGGECLLNQRLPAGSEWKFRLTIGSVDESTTYFPQGITATYWLRYATGPARYAAPAPRWVPSGIGFNEVGPGVPIPAEKPAVLPGSLMPPIMSSSGVVAGTGHYGGGDPDFLPAPGELGLAIDLDTEELKWYYDGAWH